MEFGTTEVVMLIMGLIIIVAVAIPVVVDTVATTKAGASGTVLNETFAGTAGTLYPTVNLPLLNVLSATLSTPDTKNNATALNGANETRIVYLTSDVRTSPSSLANLTIAYQANAGDAVSVALNGNVRGNLTQTGSDTWTSEAGYLVNGANNITFVNNGTLTNVTNISISYNRWASYTNYTFTTQGIIIGNNGTFKASYTYGTEFSPTMGTLLDILVPLIAVALLAFVGYMVMKQ